MDDLPPRETKTTSDCEGHDRPGDGGRAWLGLVIVVVSAAVTAALIVWVIWGR